MKMPSRAVWTLNYGTLNAGAGTIRGNGSFGDRLIISNSAGGRLRVSPDSSIPSTNTANSFYATEDYHVYVDGGEAIIDFAEPTDSVAIVALDAHSDLVLSLELRVPDRS